MIESTADINQAAALAAHELLGGAFDENTLVAIATDTNELALTRSTYDLAASMALHALKNLSPPNRRDSLACLTVLEWSREGKVDPALAQAFGRTLVYGRNHIQVSVTPFEVQ